MWWPFGKKENSAEELKKSIEVSFSNVKKDIELVKEAIKNLESKKEEHHSKLEVLHDRIAKLEKDLKLNELTPNEKNTNSILDSLTDTQKVFCEVIAGLNSESPNKWISQKNYAQELYPNEEYSKIRSYVSQCLALLEELGYVKKKLKGRQAYVMTTELNPYYREKLQQIKEKKQDKKSKQS